MYYLGSIFAPPFLFVGVASHPYDGVETTYFTHILSGISLTLLCVFASVNFAFK